MKQRTAYIMLIVSGICICIISVFVIGHVYNNHRTKIEYQRLEKEYSNTRNAMSDRYSWSIVDELTQFQNQSITLFNPQSKSELIKQFNTTNFAYVEELFASANWSIEFWSTNDTIIPIKDGFEIHNHTEYSSNHSHYKNSLTHIISTQYQFNATNTIPYVNSNLVEFQVQEPNKIVVLKVNNLFEIMEIEHIYQLTGFETVSAIKSLILIEHKLLHLNMDYSSNSNLDHAQYIPLLFDSSYPFDSETDLPDPENCTRNTYSNLQTTFNITDQSVEFFAHTSELAKNDTIHKVTLFRDGERFTRFETPHISCPGKEIIC